MQLTEIVDILFKSIQEEIGREGFGTYLYTRKAKEYIRLKLGFDPVYGARPS